ncbi:MAG: tetratricopeptide repeat protein [Bryobacteraceae bacterium]
MSLVFPGAAQAPAEEQQFLFGVLPLIQRGDLPGAEKQLLDGLSRYPRSAILFNALGIVYARQSKSEQAAASFQKALVILPSFTAAQLQLAAIRQQQGNKPEAAKWFRAAGESTTNFDALVTAGLALGDCDDYAGAVAVLEKAHAQKPDAASVAYNLALAQYKTGQFSASLESLRPIAEVDRQPDFLYLRGKVLERLGKPDAVSDMLAACQAQPGNETWCGDAGASAIRQQRFVDAVEVLQPAVEKSPKSATLLSLLGMAQFRLGRYREAIRSYTAALDCDPAIDASREGLGFLYYVTGDLEKARTVVEAGLKNPNADHYLAHLDAMILSRTSPELRVQALGAVNRSLKANPTFAPSYFLRGKIRMEQKDVPGALADFEHAVQLDPKYPLPYYKMAQIYTRLGREHQAAAAQRKFSELGNLREEEVLARQTQDVLMPAAH